MNSLSNYRNQQLKLMERIASALERLAPPATAPNYQFPLEAFKTFNWGSIGATVERVDPSGAAIINWQGMQFVRRSPDNRFGDAVWFSRSTGKKNEQGQLVYERLITFRPVSNFDVEPLPEKVQRFINGGPVRPMVTSVPR